MIEHLIYDFDGTIADSYPIFMQLWYTVAKRHNITVPCDYNTFYRELKKTGYDAYLALRCEDIITYDQFLEEFHELQEEHRMEFPAFPEAIDLLRSAKAAGKKNYLYTHTGPVVNQMLENLGIAELFEFVLDSSYHFPLKPAPDALIFLSEKLNLKPEECMMIGDRPIDAHAGMFAGMRGCLWDAEGLFPDARVDYYIKDLSEVKKIVGI